MGVAVAFGDGSAITRVRVRRLTRPTHCRHDIPPRRDRHASHPEPHREVGTIEAGKRADPIVVEGNPLRSIREIRNVRAVIANGRMFDTAALWRSVGWKP